MNPSRTLRILVTAVGGGVGQVIVKSLRMSDLDCFIVGADIEPYSAGFAFCARAYCVPQATCEKYTSRIFEICSREKIDYVFPGSDPELLALSRIKEELFRRFRCQVIVSDEHCVRICRHKLDTYRFFVARGLPFAGTASFADLKTLVTEHGFPIIAKPVDGSSSSGARVFFSHEGISALSNPERYVFQQYLVPVQWGKDTVTSEDVFTYGELRQQHEISVQVLTGLRGIILGMFMSENVLKKGIPMRVEPCDVPEVRAIALRIAEAFSAIGLFGPLNIQGKITRKGFTVFEVNPRFTGITAVRTMLGFRECEAMVRHLEGESLEMVRSCLGIDMSKIALRFVDEAIVDRGFIETLSCQGEGNCHASLYHRGKWLSGEQSVTRPGA